MKYSIITLLLCLSLIVRPAFSSDVVFTWDSFEPSECDSTSANMSVNVGAIAPQGSACFTIAPQAVTVPVTNTIFQNYTANRSNIWLTNTDWQPLRNLVFNSLKSDSVVRLSYYDNIGIYSSNWCSLAVFIDDSATPACSGSWSGPSETSVFNNQLLSCLFVLPAGNHTYTIKHRGSYCFYGNAPDSLSSVNTYLLIEELLK